MDLELNRAESEVQAEESALFSELNRWAKVSADLEVRMGTLRESAIEVDELAIVQRVQAGVPKVEPLLPFAQAMQARRTALKMRQEATARAKEQLTQLKAGLQKLVAQVVTDEKAVTEARQRALARTAVRMPAMTPPIAVRSVAAPVPPISHSDTPPRARPRVKMQAEVDFQSDNNFFNGFSTNISDGGLFIATVNLLPLGTPVDLSFSLPSGEPIEAKGVVRWVREVSDLHPEVFPGMGVQFTALHQGAQEAIDGFLAQREPLFFAAAS